MSKRHAQFSGFSLIAAAIDHGIVAVLTGRQWKILQAIMDRVNTNSPNPYCSITDICKRTGIDRRHVNRELRFLREVGLLKYDANEGFERKDWYLDDGSIIERKVGKIANTYFVTDVRNKAVANEIVAVIKQRKTMQKVGQSVTQGHKMTHPDQRHKGAGDQRHNSAGDQRHSGALINREQRSEEHRPSCPAVPGFSPPSQSQAGDGHEIDRQNLELKTAPAGKPSTAGVNPTACTVTTTAGDNTALPAASVTEPATTPTQVEPHRTVETSQVMAMLAQHTQTACSVSPEDVAQIDFEEPAPMRYFPPAHIPPPDDDFTDAELRWIHADSDAVSAKGFDLDQHEED